VGRRGLKKRKEKEEEKYIKTMKQKKASDSFKRGDLKVSGQAVHNKRKRIGKQKKKTTKKKGKKFKNGGVTSGVAGKMAG